MNDEYRRGLQAGHTDYNVLRIRLRVSAVGDSDYNKGYRAGQKLAQDTSGRKKIFTVLDDSRRQE